MSDYGDDAKQITGPAADAILKEARERLKLAIDAEDKMREDALDDLKFLSGENAWTEAALKARKGRPTLTIDRLTQYVRQVVNDYRKTRPAIDVIPADGKSAKATADVMQGLVRHIERTSRSKIAYDTAFEGTVSCGMGAFRVCTDYVDDASFDQEIRIDPIENPFTVYSDPDGGLDHTKDCWKFVTEFVDEDEFESKYGFKPTAMEDAGPGDNVPDWFDGKKVRVAEYWRIVCAPQELHALDGGTMLEGPLPPQFKAMAVRTRTIDKPTVEQYLLTYDKILKKGEWLGKYIPVITARGPAIIIDGKPVVKSMVRAAKDPARMYNYFASAETELIALQPKTPWLGPEGSFDGHEASYARANLEPVAYLEYVPKDGQPPPQRQMPPALPEGMREARMAAAEDIKATLGMYDASLGAKSNETSGVALRERKEEGDTGTFHFVDNHARLIEHCGRIILDLAPKIYDQPRMIRIIGPNDEEQMVAINQMFVDPKTGQEVTHNLDVGRYECAVRVGPSFESKRQEMVEALMQISERNPEVMAIAGDLIFKNMDWPNSEELAKRAFQMLPPQIKGDPQQPPPVPPEIQVEQLRQQGVMQKAQMDNQMHGQKLQMEAQVKQQQAAADLELQRSNDQRQSQLDQQKFQLDLQKIDREAQSKAQVAIEVAKIDMAKALEVARINRGLDDGLAAAQQAMAQSGMDAQAIVNGIGQAVQQFAGVLDAHTKAMQEHSQAVTAPRELERDPQTGRALRSVVKLPMRH